MTTLATFDTVSYNLRHRHANPTRSLTLTTLLAWTKAKQLLENKNTTEPWAVVWRTKNFLVETDACPGEVHAKQQKGEQICTLQIEFKIAHMQDWVLSETAIKANLRQDFFNSLHSIPNHQCQAGTKSTGWAHRVPQMSFLLMFYPNFVMWYHNKIKAMYQIKFRQEMVPLLMAAWD